MLTRDSWWLKSKASIQILRQKLLLKIESLCGDETKKEIHQQAMLKLYVYKNTGSKKLQNFKEKMMTATQRGRLTAFSYRISRLKNQKTKINKNWSEKKGWLYNLSFKPGHFWEWKGTCFRTAQGQQVSIRTVCVTSYRPIHHLYVTPGLHLPWVYT